MAKLTPEQKALNKQATKLRDKAFNERKNAYRAEVDAANKAIDESELAQATRDADQAFNVALEQRNEAVGAIEAQMAALKRQLDDVRREHTSVIDGLAAQRTAAWNARHSARRAAEAATAAQYPDVADCWSAAAWKPFEEFLPLVTTDTPD